MKTKLRAFLFFAALVALAGCMTRTVVGFDEVKLRQMDRHVIAQQYAVMFANAKLAEKHGRAALEMQNVLRDIPTPEALAVLEQVLIEKGITAEELAAAKERKVYLGMSLLGLYASQGKPYRENRTVSATGVSIQHVYGSLGPYVYTEDGVVISWQD